MHGARSRARHRGRSGLRALALATWIDDMVAGAGVPTRRRLCRAVVERALGGGEGGCGQGAVRVEPRIEVVPALRAARSAGGHAHHFPRAHVERRTAGVTLARRRVDFEFAMAD